MRGLQTKKPNINFTIEGYPVERHPKDYPYSYTRFCIYKNDWKDTDTMVYSDRLRSWYENYYDLKREYLGRGDYFSLYEPEQIEKFLSVLFGKNITLTGMEEECNCFNGYPYWLLYYREG